MSEITKLMEAGPTLNLRRNGWVKAPELDFSDDGNRFKGYYYDPKGVGEKRFPTSKLVSDGNAYVSVHYVNPKTGRYIYFDDLNGVSYQYAIEHLPELAKQLDDFMAKLDQEGDKVIELTPTQYSDVIAKCVQVYKMTGQSHWTILDSVLKKMGIEKQDIEKAQQNKLSKEVEQTLRNSKQDDSKIVKEIGAAYLKEVINLMRDRSGYKYNRRYESKPAQSLDDALKNAYVYIKCSDGEWHSLKDFTDATQTKIKDWARRKIETLYEFED